MHQTKTIHSPNLSIGKQSASFSTQKLVMLGMLTAVVAVLQFVGAFVRFGPFSISLVLMPIAIGAALVGVWAGAWLGLAFGLVVLMSGDAAAFMVINPLATVALVLLKGAGAGFVSGLVYKALEGKSKTAAAISAAAACPIVNTGIFILGAYAFFLPTIAEWGAASGFTNATAFIFLGMVGGNFLFELALNLILSPTITRLIQFRQDKRLR
ncbi:MAG: ECF transporter S component [Clostridiales bacterium]|nr:ECF transporter S component [Clostridiales bacterium]